MTGFYGKTLVVAVPAYDGMVPVDWVHNYLELVSLAYQSGVGVFMYARTHSSLIPKVRDEIVHDFLFKSDSQYLMCIDADIIWNPKDVMRLLIRTDEYGAIFGVYPVKSDEVFFHTHIERVDDKPVSDGNLLKIRSGSAGFMMLNRTILTDVYNKNPDLYYQAAGDFEDGNNKVCAMFSTMIDNGFYRGEDTSFCRRLAKAGHDMWVDIDVQLTHLGSKAYNYSYKDYLKKKFGDAWMSPAQS